MGLDIELGKIKEEDLSAALKSHLVEGFYVCENGLGRGGGGVTKLDLSRVKGCHSCVPFAPPTIYP